MWNELSHASFFCVSQRAESWKTSSNMKVRLYIENDNWIDDDCCVAADFFSAPRVGDYVSADWDSVTDAIIKADRVRDFREYLRGDSKDWYSTLRPKTKTKKPTEEQIRKEMNFDGIGKILSIRWVVRDGVAECMAWVGEM